MAITSKYFDGPVYESDHAKYIYYIGRRKYGVVGSSHWRVTNSTSGDRTVNIAAGTGWGAGVVTTSTTATTLSLPAPSGSSSRWHLIAMRREWGGTGGEAAFVAIAGSASKVIPSTRNSNAGVVDDQPIALVRVQGGSSSVVEIVDLRVWGDGHIRNELAMSYLTEPGAELRMGNRVFYADANGSWSEAQEEDSGRANGSFGSGWGSHPTDSKASAAYVTVRRVKVGRTYLVDVRVKVYRRGAAVTNVPNSGNITNMKIGQIPAAYAPNHATVAITSGVSGYLANGYIDFDGAIYLSAIPPGQTIPNGYGLQLTGSYLMD
jgi:hypothetical protein